MLQNEPRGIAWQVAGFGNDRLSDRRGNKHPPIALLADCLSCFQNAAIAIQDGDLHPGHKHIVSRRHQDATILLRDAADLGRVVPTYLTI